MKTLLVSTILTIALWVLVIIMDLIMWKSSNILQMVKKETNIFQVTEPAEYIIIILIILYFIVSAIVSFIKKKRQNSSPTP